MNFTTLVTQGIDRIYKEDLKSQQHFIPTILEKVRGMTDVSSLYEVKAFYVPNNEYMSHFFGPLATNPEYDLYAFNGQCVWQNFIVFPIRDITDTIVGFTGFDWVNKVKGMSDQGFDKPYYKISGSRVFTKGNYIYSMPGFFQRARKEGYLLIVDGNFDMHSLYQEGFNVGALVGSSLSDEVIFTLNFIETIYVVEDNEDAGRRLYKDLCKVHPQVRYIRQNIVKDADGLIVGTEYKDRYLEGIRKAIREKSDFLLREKPFRFSRSAY